MKKEKITQTEQAKENVYEIIPQPEQEKKAEKILAKLGLGAALPEEIDAQVRSQINELLASEKYPGYVAYEVVKKLVINDFKKREYPKEIINQVALLMGFEGLYSEEDQKDYQTSLNNVYADSFDLIEKLGPEKAKKVFSLIDSDFNKIEGPGSEEIIFDSQKREYQDQSKTLNFLEGHYLVRGQLKGVIKFLEQRAKGPGTFDSAQLMELENSDQRKEELQTLKEKTTDFQIKKYLAFRIKQIENLQKKFTEDNDFREKVLAYDQILENQEKQEQVNLITAWQLSFGAQDQKIQKQLAALGTMQADLDFGNSFTTTQAEKLYEHLLKTKEKPDAIILNELDQVDSDFAQTVIDNIREIDPSVEIISLLGQEEERAERKIQGVDFVADLKELPEFFEVLSLIKRIKEELGQSELEKEEVDFYDQRYAGDYLDVRATITAETKKELKFIEELLNDYQERIGGGKKEDLNILDAGCGNGRIAIPLAQEGYSVTGLDFSQYLLSQAERRKREANLQNLELIQGDLKKLFKRLPLERKRGENFEESVRKENLDQLKREEDVFQGKKFDAVMMNWHVFCEFLKLDERKLVLNNLFRTLKKKGTVLTLDVPMRGDQDLPSRGHGQNGLYIGEQDFNGQSYKGYIPTKKELMVILKYTGFTDIEFKEWETVAHVKKITVIARRI